MDHNQEIAAAAKRVLAPVGCFRKGRSRIWLADHGWWLGVVEFQPSGWSKGSYLNVAASYLWRAESHEKIMAFDRIVGPRPWRAAVDGESFESHASELALLARESLTALRSHHRTVSSAADWLLSEEIKDSPWHDYNLGMAFGLTRQVESSRRHFRLAVEEVSSSDEWGPPLARKCATYASLVEDPEGFRAAVQERINATRAELKLPVMDSLAFD